MSHSFVKEFPTETDNTLVLVVNENGEVSVDQETLDGFIKLGTDVSILRVDNDDGTTAEMTLDTFQHSDNMEELSVSVEDETARNYNSFRMDHCYTPLTSPSQQKPALPLPDQMHDEHELELDDLAHTLSLLEGGTSSTSTTTSDIKRSGATEQHTSEHKLLTKVNNNNATSNKQTKVSKSNVNSSSNSNSSKKVAKPIQSDEEQEEEELNDSDYDLEETLSSTKPKRAYKRRASDKSVKIRKSVTVPAPIVQPEPIPVVSPTVPVKKQIKKEKKSPKPVDDGGLALFSTPDIIRRVGQETSPKAAKIEPNLHSNRNSTEMKSPKPMKIPTTPEQPERRSSNVSISSIQTSPESESNAGDGFDQIDLENASAEMIRAIIHTDESTPSAEPTGTVQPALNLDGTGLDIDQGILDNINADELIPEDILYQVAKLVENPDVQNAIDRTLVDGGLSLDPTRIGGPATTISASHPPPSQITVIPELTSHVQQVPSPAIINQPEAQTVEKSTPQRSIQIVRSDGRVVVLPPIEKPATRSSNKKKQEPPPKISPQQQQQQISAHHSQQQQQQQQHHKSASSRPISGKLALDEAAGSELEDIDSDESWNSEDDPDRLWCICKQPHNNRFMICCDTCEDWFHGKCVNVTKAMGQLMEQQGREWMCPNCTKKTNPSGQSAPHPATGKPAKVMETASKRKSTENSPACIVCGSAARANSVYCSDACILKHAQGVEKDSNKTPKTTPQRIIVFERATGKCLSGSNAPSAANLKQWLREHPGFEVVRPFNRQNMVQSKLQVVRNPHGKEGVGVAVNRKGVQIGILPHSSKQPQSTTKLIPATKLNISGGKVQQQQQQQAKLQSQQSTPAKTRLIQTTLKSPSQQTPPKPKSAPTTPKQTEKPVVRERKQKLKQMQLQDSPKQENIRDTVKKTLNEQLLARLKEVDDLKLADDEVDKMATEIESRLYKLFGDSGPKYRTKYRSLIFNIKDPKNQTLWRRICEKTIAPVQLVRLSPEEMASQELARWREQENKHQLDMIKKSELELLTINRTYVLKTHKGEHVMEDRPSVKVDSTEMVPGLGADSTSEQDGSSITEKSDTTEHEHEKRSSSSKHSRRDRDHDHDRDRNRHSNKDHGSSRGRSKRSRSHDRDRRSERKRSRDRHHRSSRKSSRHKRDKREEHLDKKSREILDNLENNKIVPPPEDRLWKHVPQQDIQQVTTPDSDSDHEPTSTVTIPTPPRSIEPEEPNHTVMKTVTETSITTAITVPKSEPVSKPVRSSDPRLKREVSIETPKIEETTPELPPSPPSIQMESTSPVPPVKTSQKFTSESKEAIIWEGNINMVDVAKFFITLHEVSGDCTSLGVELPSTLEIVGRISPDTVWDYIGKMKRSNNKLISIVRLTAGNMEEKMPYIALYSYLNSRNRLGVIKSINNAVKDFYILPLASHAPVPQTLLPLSGPGFEESRPHLLLGIIVRAKRKRSNTMDIITSGSSAIKRSRVENNTAQISGPAASIPPARSYTPPPTRDPRIRLPSVPVANNDDDEPYSPEDSDQEGVLLNNPTSSRKSVATSKSSGGSADNVEANKTGVSTILSVAMKSSSTYLEAATVTKQSAVTSFEPFANKFDTIPGFDDNDSLERKMAELDKCIEIQKEEIRTISKDMASGGSTSGMATNLSNISLPSNLQQILDSIKNIPQTNTTQSSTTTPEEYTPTPSGYKTASASDDLTMPLLLPKLNSRTKSPPAEQITLPNLSVPPPNLIVPPPVKKSSVTIPLKLPKLKLKSAPLTPPGTTTVVIPDSKQSGSVLSSLSEEDLIRKAAEMLGETSAGQKSELVEETSKKIGLKTGPIKLNRAASKRPKFDVSQPPIPGLEDEY